MTTDEKPAVYCVKKRQSVMWNKHRPSGETLKIRRDGSVARINQDEKKLECYGNTEVLEEMMKVPINVQEVKKLAGKRPLSLNLGNQYGETPLHHVMKSVEAKWTQSELVQFFLKKGSCIYLPNNKRETPFTYIQHKPSALISDAVKSYQTSVEGRVPLHIAYQNVVPGDFHVFSRIFKSKESGCPYLYEVSKDGLVLVDISGVEPVEVQRFPGLHVARFRSSVEKADTELLIDESGMILRFTAVSKYTKYDVSDAAASEFRSPLRGVPDDAIVSGILGSLPEMRKTSRGKKPSKRASQPDSVQRIKLEIVTHPNPTLSCSRSVGSDICCDLYPMYWGPSVGVLQPDFTHQTDRFEMKVVTMLQNYSFWNAGGRLSDAAWVTRHCRLSKKLIKGEPVAMKQVGNGDYVCLSHTVGIERVTVYSPNLGHAFYNIQLHQHDLKPILVTSTTMKDVSVTDSEIPVVAVVTEESIEVHELVISKTELVHDCRPHKTSRLCYNILNSRGGGKYTATFGPDNLIILRCGVSWCDVCLCDLIKSRCYIVCRFDPIREHGEKSMSNLEVSISPDGKWLLRRNLSHYAAAVYYWPEIEEHLGTDLKKRINMTFSPLRLAPPDAEVYAIGPPNGFISLVFTDVQSSTAIWEQEPTAMQEALEIHNKLLRRIMLRFCGFEVKTEGDAFMIAFAHPIDALNWCLVSQILLMLARWPEEILRMFPPEPVSVRCSTQDHEDEEEEDDDIRESAMLGIGGPAVPLIEESHRGFKWRGVRVRMGIHCCNPLCKPDPGTGRMDYFGPPVNLAARVSGYGNGGQIVISQDTYETLQLDPNSESRKQICNVIVTSLGRIRLKGIRDEKTLYEVLPACLKDRTVDFQEKADKAKALPSQNSPVLPQARWNSFCSDGLASPVKRGYLGNISSAGFRNLNNNSGLPPVSCCKGCGMSFFDTTARYCSACGTRRRFDIDVV